MNRREMLLATASGLAAVYLPRSLLANPAKKKYKWFTHEQLMRIYTTVGSVVSKEAKNKCFPTKEKIDMDNPTTWRGHPAELCEEFYFSIHRLGNILHRRTMDIKNEHWLVMSPTMCERKIFYRHQFGEWSNTRHYLDDNGKWNNGEWIQKHWSDYIREEVSPRVFHLGHMNSRWGIFVDELFPKDVVLLGTGYKKIIQYKYTGRMLHTILNEGTSHEFHHEYPETVAYMGSPTIKNYAIIEHVPGFKHGHRG